MKGAQTFQVVNPEGFALLAGSLIPLARTEQAPSEERQWEFVLARRKYQGVIDRRVEDSPPAEISTNTIEIRASTANLLRIEETSYLERVSLPVSGLIRGMRVLGCPFIVWLYRSETNGLPCARLEGFVERMRVWRIQASASSDDDLLLWLKGIESLRSIP